MKNRSLNEIRRKMARTFVVMHTAGADLDEIKEMAKLHGVRAIHFHQLAVPEAEEGHRKFLIKAFKHVPR